MIGFAASMTCTWEAELLYVNFIKSPFLARGGTGVVHNVKINPTEGSSDGKTKIVLSTFH